MGVRHGTRTSPDGFNGMINEDKMEKTRPKPTKKGESKREGRVCAKRGGPKTERMWGEQMPNAIDRETKSGRGEGQNQRSGERGNQDIGWPAKTKPA